MAEETLLTAARRVVRFFNIDMNHGGLVSNETQLAVETLDKQVYAATEREKKLKAVVAPVLVDDPNSTSGYTVKLI